ncbi:hypothetical protein LG201_11350 [Methylobacillus gramineus]|uniref:hypothetical protein n=1 Tax=Methylobacillus gramineus TaxID=755169 RepID=UPI001D00137A|nr:hypothetical protein [Methylobacillus gramineus]MCB5185797.1 hypothetical protein [Methylobacillus gramineus]
MTSTDVLEAVDTILFSDALDEKKRFLFYLALSDEFKHINNRMAAIGFLQMAREHLAAVNTDHYPLLIQRLVTLGETDEALDLVCRHYIEKLPGLHLEEGNKRSLLERYVEQNAHRKRNIQHGHDVLLNHLHDNLHKIGKRSDGRKRVLIEIGTVRENVPGQGSTKILAEFCRSHDLHFITVDMDPHNTRMANDMFTRLGMPFEAITMKGEDYLRDYPAEFDFLFLDAYDFDHGMHSELRQSRYIKMLGAPISDAACHQMHLECAHAVDEKLAPDGLVCFDDTWLENDQWVAKGTTAMPWLLEHGLQVIEARNRAALLKRSE